MWSISKMRVLLLNVQRRRREGEEFAIENKRRGSVLSCERGRDTSAGRVARQRLSLGNSVPLLQNTHRHTQSNRLDGEETYCVLGERMRSILPDLVSTTVASLLGLRLLTPLGRFSIVARTQPTATARMALSRLPNQMANCSPSGDLTDQTRAKGTTFVKKSSHVRIGRGEGRGEGAAPGENSGAIPEARVPPVLSRARESQENGSSRNEAEECGGENSESERGGVHGGERGANGGVRHREADQRGEGGEGGVPHQVRGRPENPARLRSAGVEGSQHRPQGRRGLRVQGA